MDIKVGDLVTTKYDNREITMVTGILEDPGFGKCITIMYETIDGLTYNGIWIPEAQIDTVVTDDMFI